MQFIEEVELGLDHSVLKKWHCFLLYPQGIFVGTLIHQLLCQPQYVPRPQE